MNSRIRRFKPVELVHAEPFKDWWDREAPPAIAKVYRAIWAYLAAEKMALGFYGIRGGPICYWVDLVYWPLPSDGPDQTRSVLLIVDAQGYADARGECGCDLDSVLNRYANVLRRAGWPSEKISDGSVRWGDRIYKHVIKIMVRVSSE